MEISTLYNRTTVDNWDNFTTSPPIIVDIFQHTARISVVAHWVCAILGIFAVMLNSYVTIVLLVNKKVTCHNIFYLLVLHCAIVELLLAIALVTWSLPSLGIFSLHAAIRLATMKQWILIFLRCLNLLTILNLLLFTINEFVVVKKPLFYRRVSQKMVGILIVFAWILSFGFGAGNVVTKYFGSSIQSVYVPDNFGRPNGNNAKFAEKAGGLWLRSHNFTGLQHQVGEFTPPNIQTFTPASLYNNTLQQLHPFIGRSPLLPAPTRDKTSEEFHFPFLLATILICLTSLVIVVSCYAMILKRVRRFHREDFRAGSDCRNSSRRASTTSFTQNGASSGGPPANSSPMTPVSNVPRLSIFNGYNFNSRPSASSSTAVYVCRKTRRLNVSRHKYLLVIGSVLFVDILFILPYSTIQVLQYLYLTGYQLPSSYWWTQPRWVLQLLIGLHSVLQPLCYFRMKEFRRMAGCRKIGLVFHHM